MLGLAIRPDLAGERAREGLTVKLGGEAVSQLNIVHIQYQVSTGSWLTINSARNDAQYIAHAMRQAQNMLPGHRIRAIDEAGRLVDLL